VALFKQASIWSRDREKFSLKLFWTLTIKILDCLISTWRHMDSPRIRRRL